jgi:hypothetical protein
MRSWGLACKVKKMRCAEPIRPAREFESGRAPMSGLMLDEGRPSRHFTGWLGLASATRARTRTAALGLIPNACLTIPRSKAARCAS